ncbi:predicted protein [Arabidopsis lyrata subsp. lyrata]|uniref:Predicted protein n=1 Tax=Arabidopsis lyrata subsp. lyrata TaxID=81972 RepID=D7M671_ARALL|nr:predicted protein [Arabidopsis lyrata subsp. lyrata]
MAGKVLSSAPFNAPPMIVQDNFYSEEPIIGNPNDSGGSDGEDNVDVEEEDEDDDIDRNECDIGMNKEAGHTFGAGGIEQVKQMGQSFVSAICICLFSFAYEAIFRCVLLESLLHMFTTSLRRIDNPKSQ